MYVCGFGAVIQHGKSFFVCLEGWTNIGEAETTISVLACCWLLVMGMAVAVTVAMVMSVMLCKQSAYNLK